ncbi:hypothetical protein C7377_0839 [Balneicella halophila]|uniref:Uncharacterized protein n=1 Tax=Balneicella halophila TaxID=1537566 RepID=A0A7L4URV5_BALHA|nr:hypothetical protein [Balneicella halophila]PVX52515.1 hypothetical protein C7377_0839 [Balneicella halophila]
MRKLRTGLIILAVLLIIAQLCLFDYKDLGSPQNIDNYLGITAMLCLIIAMIIDRNKKE